MSFIDRELSRIKTALADPASDNYDRLWAAQQALAWALEPDGYASPMRAITGIRGATEGCQASSRPVPS